MCMTFFLLVNALTNRKKVGKLAYYIIQLKFVMIHIQIQLGSPLRGLLSEDLQQSNN